MHPHPAIAALAQHKGPILAACRDMLDEQAGDARAHAAMLNEQVDFLAQEPPGEVVLPAALRKALEQACSWVKESGTVRAPWEGAGRGLSTLRTGFGLPATARLEFQLWRGPMYPSQFERAAQTLLDAPSVDRTDLSTAVSELAAALESFAVAAARDFGADAVRVPEPTVPPRHASLKRGFVGRLVAEDLTAVAAEGRTLLHSGADPVLSLDWLRRCDKSLNVLAKQVRESYRDCVDGCTILHAPIPGTVAAAYLELAIEYLERVVQRMPDYTEASGQGPAVSITGSTIYGGQFAAQITNIDSTIAGIAAAGDERIAQALKDLEEAIASDNQLDAATREDLLDNVADLADTAQAAPEQRRRGRFRAALDAIKTAADTGTSLAKAVEAAEPVLAQLMS